MNKVYGLRLISSVEANELKRKARFRGTLRNYIFTYGIKYVLDCHLGRIKRYYI